MAAEEFWHWGLQIGCSSRQRLGVRTVSTELRVFAVTAGALCWLPRCLAHANVGG